MAQKARKPLDNVNGNASQLSAATNSSFPTNDVIHEHCGGLAKLSSFEEETQENVAPDAPQNNGMHISKGETSSAPITISSDEASQPREISQDVHDGKCQFAGNKCHLFGQTILLATTALGPSQERTNLMRAHGVIGSVMTLNDWLEKNNPGAALSNTSGQTIILVDTVEKAKETKTVLAELERARQGLPRKTRQWMAVYDWRVLNHLQTMEDGEIRQKYYDGFHDPWRRWYCGII
jgi:DNA ligase-4